MTYKHDPGPCPVDDAPHTTCTSPDYDPLTIPQLPGRDGVARVPTVCDVHVPAVIAELRTPPLVADVTASVPVTTGTYRRRPSELPGRPRRR